MSRGGAIGRPMLSGAMGMLGLDPMSLGLRAGMGAWSSGAGVLGAGMAGMGVAAGVGIIGAGAAYAGNQMYSGAQQQLMLNQSLRGFNFQNHQGGMGFTSNQGFQIGNQLRSMSHEFGPSGEVATFGELSRLATNMGRMGFANNVRSVSEFKDKFKEMVDTLKKVATDMGSSLEEAQKFVQSMRGSGIFRTADQLKMSAGTRLAATAGGLAMSEVTGMANIGSQISRSVGGLGRSGAFGGMKTIEQIGLAQRVGAISDEDIYNATGLYGAEGRQAMATAQMQQSARFLSTGRGRRFLASVSGKDGNLDEASAMEYLMGGDVTTGRTMEMAHRNLAGVGRANFIRNEGRLRGAALEKFGGLAQSMVYQQWLSSRGYDPSTMDDKSMLAFQRFSGMGRDEADLAIKQINALPQMMREMQKSESMMGYADELNKHRKTHGIEGLKRKFEQTQEHINGALQKAGSDILRAGSETIAKWFNKTMDTYERSAVEDLHETLQAIKLGGPGGARLSQDLFGTKASLAGAAAGAGFGGDRFKEFDRVQALKFGAMGGARDQATVDFARANANTIRQATLAGIGGSGSGAMDAFGRSLQGAAKDDPRLAGMAERYAKASPAEKAAMMQTMQETVGTSKDAQLLSKLDKEGAAAMSALGGRGKYATQADEEAALGRMIAGQSADVSKRKQNWKEAALGGYTRGAGQAVGAVAGLAEDFSEWAGGTLGGLYALATGDRNGMDAAGRMVANAGTFKNTRKRFMEGDAAGDEFAYDLLGDKAMHQGIARTLKDPNTRRQMARLLDGGASEADRGAVLSEVTRLRKDESHLSDEDKDKLIMLSNTAVGAKHATTLAKIEAGQAVTKDELDRMARDYQETTGKTLDTSSMTTGSMMSLRSAMKIGKAALGEQQVQNFMEAQGAIKKENVDQQSKMVNMGIATMGADGKLTISAAKKKGMTDAQARAADLALGITQTNIGVGSFEQQYDAYEGWRKKHEELQATISTMSLAEKQEFARRMAGSEAGMTAAISAKREKQLANFEAKYGKSGAAAKLLGLDIGKDVLANIDKSDNKALALLQQGGVTVDANDPSVKALNEALASKTVGGRADAIARVVEQDPSLKKKLQEAQKSQEDPSFRELQAIRKAADDHSKLLKQIATQKPASPEDLQKLLGGAENSSGTGGAKQPGT